MSTSTRRQEHIDRTFARRQRIALSWLDSALVLARKSSDSEAWAVAKLLRTHARVASPIPGGISDAGRATPKSIEVEAIYLVPMLSQDLWHLPIGDHRHELARKCIGTVGARFVPRERTIYLPGEIQLSELSMGLLLLHEGLHAYDRVVRRRRMPRPFWRREYNAVQLEMRILKAIGGSRFERYLEQLTPRVATLYGDAQDQDAFHLDASQRLVTDDDLRTLFGGFASHDERRLIAVNVLHAAADRFFRTSFSGTKPQRLAQMYVRSHMTANSQE